MPTFETGQFGSFDGRDNRKEILILLQRLGDGLPEDAGNKRRAAFLQGLIKDSTNGFAKRMAIVQPCDAPAAYYFFVHICGVLGVEINGAARKLERTVMALK